MESATVLKKISYSHTHQPSWVLEWGAEQTIQVTVQLVQFDSIYIKFKTS